MNSMQQPPSAQQDLSLDPFWMPFTANRQFKARPRLLTSAEGMFYTDVEGRQVIDGANKSIPWTTLRPSKWVIRYHSNWPND